MRNLALADRGGVPCEKILRNPFLFTVIYVIIPRCVVSNFN
jgi:hypothetical protein